MTLKKYTEEDMLDFAKFAKSYSSPRTVSIALRVWIKQQSAKRLADQQKVKYVKPIKADWHSCFEGRNVKCSCHEVCNHER